MSGDEEDEALRWEGDEDVALPRGWRAVGKGSEKITTRDGDEPAGDEAGVPSTLDAADAPLDGSAPLDQTTSAGEGGRGESRAEHAEAAAPVDGRDAGERDEAATGSLGNVELIALGIVGGVYLLYAIGWIIGGIRLTGAMPSLVSDIMFQGSIWLAAAAAFVWFLASWLLTRRQPRWMRWLALVGGVLLFIPWPFVMTGSVGV